MTILSKLGRIVGKIEPMKEQWSLAQEVEKVIKMLRPELQSGGSYIELLSVSSYGVVRINLSGSCLLSSHERITTLLDIEKILKEQISEIKFVIQG